jgi:hypothetical protein
VRLDSFCRTCSCPKQQERRNKPVTVLARLFSQVRTRLVHCAAGARWATHAHAALRLALGRARGWPLRASAMLQSLLHEPKSRTIRCANIHCILPPGSSVRCTNTLMAQLAQDCTEQASGCLHGTLRRCGMLSTNQTPQIHDLFSMCWKCLQTRARQRTTCEQTNSGRSEPGRMYMESLVCKAQQHSCKTLFGACATRAGARQRAGRLRP